MADQKEWAKLWFAALSDEDVLALPPAKRWAWAAMIAYTKKHGTNGTVMIRPESDFLAVALGVPKEHLLSTIKCLPHVQIGDAQSEHGMFACSFTNWYKYQVDSTHAERQKRARSKRRGEEKRKENKESSLRSDSSSAAPEKTTGATAKEWPDSDLWLKNFLDTQTFVNLPQAHLKALQNPDFWERTSEACGGIDLALLQVQFAKMGNWLADNPSRVPTARGFRRFVSGWLERSYEKERRYGNQAQKAR